MQLESNIARPPVVAIWAPNCAEWPALLIAILRVGGVVLLEDFEMAEHARLAAEHACGATHRAVWRDGEIEIFSLTPCPESIVAAGLPAGTDVIKLTSGTTGLPRGIAFSANQLIADCDAVCDTMRIMDRDVNFGVISFAHSYGFSNLITPLLCRGIALVAARDVLPRALIHALQTSKASVVPLVPALFDAMARLGGNLPDVRLCISAGAPLRPETHAAFRGAFGHLLHTFYGASECGGICYDASGEGSAEAGFVGEPMRGVHLIGGFPSDGTGIPFRVASRAVGLKSIPNDPNDGFGNQTYQPGDLLAKCPTGYRVTGRSADFINVAGRRLDPHLVESAFRVHPAVSDAVAFGWGDDRRSEAVYAAVCLHRQASEESLRTCASAHLASWQQPRKIFFVEAFPLTARGKLSRSLIAQQLLGISENP